jgi:hypothetical protein
VQSADHEIILFQGIEQMIKISDMSPNTPKYFYYEPTYMNDISIHVKSYTYDSYYLAISLVDQQAYLTSNKTGDLFPNASA